MSHLIVLTFSDMEQAGEAYDVLKGAESSGYVTIEDAAVIVKQPDGKVEIKNQLNPGVKWGAIGGSVLGLLLSGVFFPLAGLTLGAVGGAIVGKSLDFGLDKTFIQNVTETLAPGTSALFLMGASEDPDVFMASLRPFQGRVYQATLKTEALEALRSALDEKE